MKNMGDMKTIIAWLVTRDLGTRILKICQSAYIKNFLEEENFTNCNAPTIPIKAGLTIEMNKPDDYNKTNLAMYQQLIGKLIYLACRTRPDIAFAGGRLGNHNADPRKKYFRAAKQVICYFKGTMYLELV